MDTLYDKNLYIYRSKSGDVPVMLREQNYENSTNLCLTLVNMDGTTYAPLTKFFVPLQEGFAFVDNSSLPWAEEFINRNGLGKFMGKYYEKKFFKYPLYRFYMATIRRM